MHEDPQIPNFGEPGKGPELEEGMVLAIEPMVNAGGPEIRMGDDGWAVYSQDDSLAAHFEFTVAVTADGPRVLTPWHEAIASPLTLFSLSSSLTVTVSPAFLSIFPRSSAFTGSL